MTTNEIDLSSLTPGDVIVVPEHRNAAGWTWPEQRRTVIDIDGERIRLTNPDAGNVRGNRNRAAVTQTFKLTSPTLAARLRGAYIDTENPS